jgi:glycosyltransferase involved in cell wall biosynthesis
VLLAGSREGSRIVHDRDSADRRQGAPPAPRALLIEPQPFFTDRGTPIAVRSVLRALSELGWEVDVLTFPMGAPLSIRGVTIQRVGNPLGFRDVVVGFSFKKVFLDILLALRLPGMLRRRGYAVVHGVEEAAFLLGLFCRRDNPPIVYDMASSLPEQLATHPVLGLAPIQWLLSASERWLLRRAGCVVCSAGLGDRASRAAAATKVREWRFPAELGAVAPDEVASLRAEYALDGTRQVIVYVGNFAPYQGVDKLLTAARQLLPKRPRSVLFCIGASSEGELAAAKAMVPASLSERVHLLPRQPRERVPVFLALADILVSPRSYGSNFPLKLFDYLAAGRAIVATEIPAHTCVLDQNLACLVPPTPQGLAEGLAALLDSPHRIKDLAAAATAYANRELTWERFRSLVEEIYAVALLQHPVG